MTNNKFISNNIDNIALAAAAIKNGSVVGFPTETVYGLGADATNPKACLEIYNLKQRPANNPLIVHFASIDEVQEYAVLNSDAISLAKVFWPGPLTLILPIREGSNISTTATAGLPTIGIRIPNHPVALELIRKSECPIAAPSANVSGYISPTSSKHVREAFPNIIVLDGTRSKVGLESTILDLSGSSPQILRPGFITKEALESVLKQQVFDHISSKVIAPGMMYKHYSPKTKLILNIKNPPPSALALNFGSSNLTGVYSLNLSKKGDLIEAASNLYYMLRELDDYAIANSIEYIIVAPIPNISIGIAINERLNKAASN